MSERALGAEKPDDYDSRDRVRRISNTTKLAEGYSQFRHRTAN